MIRGKDLMIYLVTPLLAVSLPFMLSAKGSTASTKGTEWYCTPNNEHRRPQFPQEFEKGSGVLYCGSDSEKKVALTFDAGFDNGCHAPILNTLREKKVSAAFFVDGNFLKQNQALVQRMAAEGHTVGNHTLHHADMTALTDFNAYRKQIDGWNELLQGYGLTPSGYFRFPCGKYSEQALEYNRELGLTSVFWSFAYYDWVENEQPDPDAALEKIMSRIHNGCILLLHSTSRTNTEILGTLIDRLRAEGYEIVPLNELQQHRGM